MKGAKVEEFIISSMRFVTALLPSSRSKGNENKGGHNTAIIIGHNPNIVLDILAKARPDSIPVFQSKQIPILERSSYCKMLAHEYSKVKLITPCEHPQQDEEDISEDESYGLEIAPQITKVNSIYNFVCSFFPKRKKENTDVLKVKALRRYAALEAEISEEIECMLLAITEKQQERYDHTDAKFNQNLMVDLAGYPQLSVDKSLLVSEIEQVIKDREEYHAKIKLAVESYLSSFQVDNFIPTHNTQQEI